MDSKTQMKQLFSEEEFTERIEKGDIKAFERLFDIYYAPLSSFAFKYLKDKHIAEDIVQDLFFDIWNKQYRFHSNMALKTFMYRSVRNRSLDVLRRRKVQNREHPDFLQDESDFFLEQIIEKEVAMIVRHRFELLPESTRQIFEMSLLGYKNKEIADALNLTVESVKARKQRGKQILYEQLKRFFVLFL